MAMFISGKSATQISKSLGVKYETVRRWRDADGWVEARRRAVQEALEKTVMQYTAFIAEELPAVVSSQMRMATSLEEEVSAFIDLARSKKRVLHPRDLAFLSSTLRVTSEMKRRLMGLDGGLTEKLALPDSEASRKLKAVTGKVVLAEPRDEGEPEQWTPDSPFGEEDGTILDPA